MTDRDAVGRLMWHMGSDRGCSLLDSCSGLGSGGCRRGCSGDVRFVSVTTYKVLEFCSTVTLSDRNKDHP